MSSLWGLCRWSLQRGLRTPGVWIALCLLWGLWLASVTLGPTGLTSSTIGTEPLYYEIAFLSLLAGCTLALLGLEEVSELLRASPHRTRTASTIAVLACGAVAGLVACGFAVLPAHGRLGWPGIHALRGVGLAALHLAVIGALTAQLPLPSGLRGPIFLSLAWLVPNALPPEAFAGRWLRLVLDSSRHLVPEPSRDPALLAGALLPPLGLALACALLDRGNTLARSDLSFAPAAPGGAPAARRDEVRDPR